MRSQSCRPACDESVYIQTGHGLGPRGAATPSFPSSLLPRFLGHCVPCTRCVVLMQLLNKTPSGSSNRAPGGHQKIISKRLYPASQMMLRPIVAKPDRKSGDVQREILGKHPTGAGMVPARRDLMLLCKPQSSASFVAHEGSAGPHYTVSRGGLG